MKLETLRCKDVRVMIKNGSTLGDICDKYECGQKDLRSRLNRIFSYDKGTIRSLYAQMEKNAKKARKRKEVKEIIEEKEETLTEIETLRQLEDQQSKKLMSLETTHVSLTDKVRTFVGALKALDDDLEEMRQIVLEKRNNFEKDIDKTNQLIRERNSVTEELKSAKEVLDRTRARIEKLETVEIFVFNDGTIAPADDSDVVFDDSGHEELFKILVEKDECQELRTKDVRVLAKIMKTVEHISAKKVDVVFDNSELETVYGLIKFYA